MKFHEFAQLLHPIIGGASSTHVFAKTLFDAITTDEGNSVLEEVTPETYKSYYNGNTGITRLAKKLSAYVDPVEFVSYCEPFTDATMNTLYDRFKACIPDMTKNDVAESLADFFHDIIFEAAATKRQNSNRLKAKTEQECENKARKIADSTGATVAEGFTSFTEQVMDEDQTTNNEKIEAEVVDDEKSSGAADDGNKTTVIHQNVIQNGENNFNLTNNGTMNFNF